MPFDEDILEAFGLQDYKPGTLFESEEWWAKRYRALEQKGYLLRKRYHPDWVPSWHGTKKHFTTVEDGQHSPLVVAMDATRLSDGAPVLMKKVLPEEGPYEEEIAQYFSSSDLRSDPRNHCVPIEVIQLSGEDIDRFLVMPLLRPFMSPPFDTYGEVISFLTQVFEGIQFMHEHHVAHRDCTKNNIMLDPSGMYPDGFHPVRKSRTKDWKGKARHYTRTQRPPRYFLIDFGLSRRYKPEDGPPLDDPLRGGDKSAPEHQPPARRCDPFPTDIYYLGNLIREHFIQKAYGFEFVEALVADMVQDDPTKRPTIHEVVSRFQGIRKSLHSCKLRSRIRRRSEISVVRFWRACGHLCRTVGYVATRKAAIPDP